MQNQCSKSGGFENGLKPDWFLRLNQTTLLEPRTSPRPSKTGPLLKLPQRCLAQGPSETKFYNSISAQDGCPSKQNQNIHALGAGFKHADALSMGNAGMHWCWNPIPNRPTSENWEMGGPGPRYHKFSCSLFLRLPLRNGLSEINLLKLHDWLRTDYARTGPWRAINFSVL